ncbi:MAG: GNAT family N-acetyltransferase [Sarcina sp.]
MQLKLKHFNELTTVELYEILKSRVEVFVVEQNCPYQDVDEKDKYSYHLFYEEDGRVVSYIRLIEAGRSYQVPSIGRVITLKEYRNKGLSRKLLVKGIELIKDLYESKEIKISAQAHLQYFYESVGFKKITEIYLEDDIPHIGMEYKEI